MTNQEIKNYINNYPSKHEQGFTRTEVERLCASLEIDVKRVRMEMGCVTGMLIGEDSITYHSDVIYGVLRVSNPNQRYLGLFD
jgi:hypothetical protein